MFASSWVNLLQVELFHQETRSNPEVLPDAFVAKDFVVDTEVIQEVLKW